MEHSQEEIWDDYDLYKQYSKQHRDQGQTWVTKENAFKVFVAMLFGIMLLQLIF